MTTTHEAAKIAKVIAGVNTEATTGGLEKVEVMVVVLGDTKAQLFFF